MKKGNDAKKKSVGGKIKWIIIGIVVVVIIGAAIGGQDTKKNDSSKNNAQEQKEEIEYTVISVNQMIQELNDNAMGASENYKDKYLEITGGLAVIDSSGKYISLYPDDDFALIGAQCYIANDEQKNAVMNMAKGDTVTLRGKCTDVGEVLGYTVDIDSIVE